MRSLTYLFVSFTLLQSIVSACCQVKKIGSCCGKGKCNIFCCNCNGGCLATDVCSYRHCEDVCAKKNTNAPALAACIATCYFGVGSKMLAKSSSRPGAVDEVVVKISKTTQQHVLNDPVDSEEVLEVLPADEKLFYDIDYDRVGYFTYGQFLAAMEWDDTEYSRDHFKSFDRNGDGRITLDEMRN